MPKKLQVWNEFQRYMRKLYLSPQYTAQEVQQYTRQTWRDYIAGIRDGRLPDCAIFLIDRLGY